MAKKLTTEEFIKKAKITHGDKFDYSKTKYVNAKTDVVITCPIHGDITQNPANHTAGRGCRFCISNKCGQHNKSTKRLTTATFIEKANVKHNHKYTYTSTHYTRSHEKVIITCPIHGDFLQTPNSHLNGCACPDCGKVAQGLKRRKALEQFIADANIKHNNKYTYESVDYCNSTTKIIITCPQHGDFLQTPMNHLDGNGCTKCAKKYKRSTAEFIEDAKKVHGANTYDYSLTVFKNVHTKVKIICKKHGEFLQEAADHLNGLGCNLCGNERIAAIQRKPLQQFIAEANTAHCNIYNYDNVNYINSDTPVIITCPKHGDFLQRPYNHIHRRQGCYLCTASKGEHFITQWLEEQNLKFTQQYKLSDCQNKRPLPFDFALLHQNTLIGLIEFQGRQHYEPIDFFGGEATFKQQQYNDNSKRTYCQTHNIPLLEIPYWLSDDEIIEKLSQFSQEVACSESINAHEPQIEAEKSFALCASE